MKALLAIALVIMGLLFLAALNHNSKAFEGIDPCPNPDRPALDREGNCVSRAYENIDPDNYNTVK